MSTTTYCETLSLADALAADADAPHPWPAEHLGLLLGGGLYRAVAARQGGELIGWALWTRFNCSRDAAFLLRLVVRAGARGRGVGRGLLEGVFERASAAGCNMLLCRVPCTADYRPARRLFEGAGMRQTRTVVTEWVGEYDAVLVRRI